MAARKEIFVTGQYYHVFSKSIAGYTIFNNHEEFLRMKTCVEYYQFSDVTAKFSYFLKYTAKNNPAGVEKFLTGGRAKFIKIVAYCLMPTHIHFVVQQLKDQGITIFLGNVLNSYAKYFNLRHHRKGPLWEGRFRSVLVEDDEQLLHLTRYVHLNPVTACLVNAPEAWPYSSYNEYIQSSSSSMSRIVFDISQTGYKKFVEDRIAYQRELAKIKSLILE